MNMMLPSQLWSFLGLVNYYVKFLPKLSSTLAPLHRLLRKKTTWTWGPEQQKAYTYSPIGQRGSSHCVWGEEVSPLFLQTPLHNHKLLQHLFSETQPVPAMASARIQRWALTLSAYSYAIAYKPGGDHINVDVLSRLPLPEAPSDVPLSGETVLL